MQYLPHVAPEGGTALIQGGEPYEYCGTTRGSASNYRNEITADTGYTMLTLDGATAADLLTPTPALIVPGEKDAYCTPEQALAVYERIDGAKEVVWLPADTHIAFHDDTAIIDAAVTAAVAFLQHRQDRVSP